MPERVDKIDAALEMEEELDVLPEREEETREKEKVPAIIFAKPGEIHEGKIVAIYRGKMSDFYDIESIEDEQIKKRLEQIMDDPAFEVHVFVPKLGVTLRDIIRVSFHEMSHYIELAKCYGQLSEGDKVWVEIKSKGKAKITCPPRMVG